MLSSEEEQRAIFMNNIAEVVPDPEMLIFKDEAAKDQRTLVRWHDFSLRVGGATSLALRRLALCK